MRADSIYLAIAPNILRKTVQDLSRMDYGLDLIPPQTHQEMLDFSIAFGRDGSVPGLTLCAYPQFLHNVMQCRSTGELAVLPDTLPPMRHELTALGMAEPSRHFRTICLVPFVIAASNAVVPPIEDWEDLCRPDIADRVAVPPDDTPMPALFDTMMRALCGQRAQRVIEARDTRFTPLDINKRIDAGEFLAGLNIPAFSRTYREGNGRFVWPRSGAWTVPLVATVRADAPPDAMRFMEYLLSNEYQTYLADTGGLVPVVEGIPWFREMADSGGTLLWPGWDTLLDMGRPDSGQQPL